MRYSFINMRHFEQTIYRRVCLRAGGGRSVVGWQVLPPLKPKDQPDLRKWKLSVRQTTSLGLISWGLALLLASSSSSAARQCQPAGSFWRQASWLRRWSGRSPFHWNKGKTRVVLSEGCGKANSKRGKAAYRNLRFCAGFIWLKSVGSALFTGLQG